MDKEFLKNVRGAVFDLDGTILDSAWVWDRVDVEFLGKRGFDVPEHYVETISPMGAEKAAVYTINEFGLHDENIEDIVEEWFEMAREHYHNDIVCKPYVKDYIKLLYDNNTRLVVATSSDRSLFMETLKRESILQYFEDVVTVSEVKRGKGFPDIYEEAARRIETNPGECVVFEDILKGIEGAKAGGFITVAVHDIKSEHNRTKMAELADLYIDDFKELL